MAKSFYEMTRHPMRVLALFGIALAVGLVALWIGSMDSQAGHTGGLIELDVKSVSCPSPKQNATPFPTCGDANTVNDGAAQSGANDWQDVCSTFALQGIVPPVPPAVSQPFFANDITEDPTLPADVDVVTCDRDYFKSDQTYFDSEKDILDICGDSENPCAGTSAGVGGVPSNDTWECVELANPLDKNEILNGYAAQGVPSGGAAAGDTVLYFGFERRSNEGTAFMGFWFLQNDADCTHAGSGRTSFSGGPHAVRCGILTPPAGCPGGESNPGDILALVNYTGGGRIADIRIGAWDPGLNDCTPAQIALGGSQSSICTIFTSGDCSDTALPADDTACAVVNTREFTTANSLLAPWNNDCVPAGPIKCNTGTRSTLGVNQFFEGNINLTELLCPTGGPTPTPTSGCDIPCFSTFVAETRTSAEFTATLKDFVRGDFNTCTAAITVKKVDLEDNLLPGACYTIAGAGVSIPVCDGSPPDEANGDDGIVCVDGLGSGTYTVTETTAPPGYIGDPIAKTVIIPGPLLTNTDCPKPGDPDAVFVNTLGSLAWEKRSDVDGSLLTGAQFTVTPNPFDCTGGAIESPILDNAGSDADPDDGQYLIEDVCLNADGSARTYTITETQAPPNFGLDPDADRTCQVSAASPDCVVGTQGEADDCPDTSGSPDANGGPAGTDTGSDFCNPVGKLRFEKVQKDASEASGKSPFPGATFRVTGTGVDITVTDGSPPDADPADGSICLDDIPLNVALTISETDTNNDNYLPDTVSRTVTVASSGTCESDSSVDTLSPAGPFENTPLSEIQILFRSLGINGDETAASIACTSQTADSVSGGPQPGDDLGEDGAADPAFDDSDELFTALAPGTYNCTIIIDP